MSATSRSVVSVLLPVRNGLPYLRAAIDSILSQDHPFVELLIIDDGSTDGSAAEALARFDPRVRLLTSPGHGLAAALNLGLETATGQYVARQDADDRSLPQRLARQASFLDAHPDIDVLATRVSFVNDGGALCRNAWTDAVENQWEEAEDPAEIAALLPLTCCLVHGSVMARREVLVAAGGYRPDLAVAQDYDLWLRLLPHHRFARLPDRLYEFRVHERQTSAVSRDAQTVAAIAAKLSFLAKVPGLGERRRTIVLGNGRGAALYRQSLSPHGFVEVPASDDWDVAVFTDFSTLEPDMTATAAAIGDTSATRVGNFLVRSDRAA